MSAPDLLACAVSAWYPVFKAVTFKTVLIPLPQEFVDYLVADGVHLPSGAGAFAQPGADPYASDDDWGSNSGSEAEGQQVPKFPELVAQIGSAIEQLGGAVVPKFTWSCPKDAVWMTVGHTLACQGPGEVLLLLKGSDRVAHDICHALEGGPMDLGTAEAEAVGGDNKVGAAGTARAGGPTAAAAAAAAGPRQAEQGPGAAAVQHVLALRRWHDLRPEREFRCFVRDDELVGVSQREVTEFYPSLVEEQVQIQQRILDFHRQHIQGKFPLPHYTYDVYVAATAEAVKLLDFNPIAGTTSPLLFDWEELPFGDILARQQRAAAGGSGDEGLGAAGLSRSGAGSAAAGSATGEGPPPQRGAGSNAANAPRVVDAPDSTAGVNGGAGGSYLQQLRQVQALSLQEQPKGSPAPASSLRVGLEDGFTQHSDEDCGCCGSGAPGTAAAVQEAQQVEQAQHEGAQAPPPGSTPPTGRSAPSSSSSSGSCPAAPFEFRVLTNPVAMRPSKMAYGVPYDFVDVSEGSALDSLMKQLGGQGGPDELFAALRAQAG